MGFVLPLAGNALRGRPRNPLRAPQESQLASAPSPTRKPRGEPLRACYGVFDLRTRPGYVVGERFPARRWRAAPSTRPANSAVPTQPRVRCKEGFVVGGAELVGEGAGAAFHLFASALGERP